MFFDKAGYVHWGGPDVPVPTVDSSASLSQFNASTVSHRPGRMTGANSGDQGGYFANLDRAFDGAADRAKSRVRLRPVDATPTQSSALRG